MAKLITTQGAKSASELGMILPHEHVFVDLRIWDQPGYAQAETDDVIRLMAPEIEKAKTAHVTAIVECSAIGVGRRADIEKAISDATDFPLVIPTGVYREPWVPDWVHHASESELTAWMLRELQEQIEESGVQAGWIKLSAGDEGITACEKKILRAAALAAKETNTVIGSHTIRGRVVREQLDIIEAAGYNPERFIWIHTQAEPDFGLHLEIGKRGAWLEYDAIGNLDVATDEHYLELIQRVLDTDLGEQLLLSHDRGWYDPAQPGGGLPKPFTYLSETFLPKLSATGVDAATIKQLTQTNPFNAFAR
jgi:phosphotriesterase-related protein